MGEEKVAYRCASCNHKFRRSFAPRVCPMCGKETVTADKSEGAASDMIREIEDMESQFS